MARMSSSFQRSVLLVFVMLLFAGSCSKLPFFKDEEKDYPRAFYVDKKDFERPEKRGIRMEGNLKEAIKLMEDSMQATMDTTTDVLRIDDDSEENTGPGRKIMKVITPKIEVDSLDEFQELFAMGEYIIDDPDVLVKPEGLSYQMVSVLSLDGRRFDITIQLIGYINWNLYQENRRGKLEKIPEEEEKMYGVGKYRYRKPYTYVDRRGNEQTAYVWRTVNVEDEPESRGIIEKELQNKMIELAAIRNLSAQITSQRR